MAQTFMFLKKKGRRGWEGSPPTPPSSVMSFWLTIIAFLVHTRVSGNLCGIAAAAGRLCDSNCCHTTHGGWDAGVLWSGSRQRIRMEENNSAVELLVIEWGRSFPFDNDDMRRDSSNDCRPQNLISIVPQNVAFVDGLRLIWLLFVDTVMQTEQVGKDFLSPSTPSK